MMELREPASFQLPLTSCPVCKYKIDSITNVTADRAPRVGTFTVCICCVTILIVGEGMVIRRATSKDLTTLPSFLRLKLREFQQAVRQAKKKVAN